MSKEDKETIGRLLDQLTFNNEGLIPAIAQQFDSGEVLMLAWMSPESIEATLKEEIQKDAESSLQGNKNVNALIDEFGGKLDSVQPF